MYREKGQFVKVAGLVVAAGSGKRMAVLGPKPFLKFNDQTFIEKIVDQMLRCAVEPIYVVTNPIHAERMKKLIGEKAETVINRHSELGMFSSVQCGIFALMGKGDVCLMTPVDLPLVKDDTYRKIVAACITNPEKVIKPVYMNQRGHPVAIPASIYPSILEALPTSTLRNILRQFYESELPVEVSDPGIIRNINTPELYNQFCPS